MAGLPERMRAVIAGRIERERADTALLRDRSRRRLHALLESARSDLDHVRARVRTLSPQATLDRGYAVVRRPDGTVVRDAGEALGTLRIRVARGEFDAVVP
jgi:exodeoxyribonuclease VII large subunit